MSAALVWAGVVVGAAAAVRLMPVRDRDAARGVFRRLHFVSVAGTLAGPLVIAGLALAPWSSWHDVVKLIVIGALLFVTGPATVIAAARAADARNRPGGTRDG